MSDSILIVRCYLTKWKVRYVRFDKRGGVLHRSIDCYSDQEAAATAMDIKRRLFRPTTKIVAPPEVLQYIR